jgi:hypothetical protein
VTKMSCPVSVCRDLYLAPYVTPLQCCVKHLSGEKTYTLELEGTMPVPFNIRAKRDQSK